MPSMEKGDVLGPLDAILAGDCRFGHLQHVQLAWHYLHRTTPAAAEGWMRAAIQHVAAAHGTPDKYHETLTVVWTRLVAGHVRSHDAPTFDQFIARNEALLDVRLPERHFSKTTLWSDRARREWVDPDLLPLP
jgi:hypothetical protein